MGKPNYQILVDYGDVHWNKQDPASVSVVLQAIQHLRPHITCIGGDLLDCNEFSVKPRFDFEELANNWKEEEWDPAIEHLKEVAKYTRRRRIFLEGNHEQRIIRAAVNGISGTEQLLSFANPRKVFPTLGYQYVPYMKGTEAMYCYSRLTANLISTHGWNFSRYAADRHLDQSRELSVIFHHTHRDQRASTRLPFSHKEVVAVSGGCLCKLQPIYMEGGRPNDWTHGFVVGYLTHKDHQLYTVKINKGRAVLPDGHEIVAQ